MYREYAFAKYPEPGSNRHGLLHWCLRPARLPIPPSGRDNAGAKVVFMVDKAKEKAIFIRLNAGKHPCRRLCGTFAALFRRLSECHLHIKIAPFVGCYIVAYGFEPETFVQFD